MGPLGELLSPHRLQILGTCAHDGGTLAMIGPDEPSFWDHFAQSPEYLDGQADAMDRWSKRVLDQVAETVDGKAYYPFGGPPFHPFFTWALATGRFWSSPINFLVHDTAGLFVSFRGAIWLDQPHVATTPPAKPCDTCETQPCKSACPVDAFADGYDVDACKTHLASSDGTPCMSTGCAARRACPVGQGRRQADQAAFHMKAFL